MTWTLTPFDDKHRLDGRSYKNRIGRPFYGEQLRRAIYEEPSPSMPSRIAEWYFSRRWPSRVLALFGLLVAAFTLAAWIVL